MDQVESEWVETHVDTGNSRMAWEDPVDAVRALAPKAISSHFKDHIVILEEGTPLVVGVPLGVGSIDCRECLRILAEESPLERLAIEVCYGYSAPFRRSQERGPGGRLGEGAFRVVEGPFDPARVVPHPKDYTGEALERLDERQHEAVVQGLAYTRSLLEELA